MPGTSMRWPFGGRLSGMKRQLPISARMPIGRLTRKIARQPAERMQADQRAAAELTDHGREAEHETVEAHHAHLLLRVNTLRIVASTCGARIAANRPCSTRPPTSTAPLPASPRRRDDEAGHPDHEHPLAAVQVAEPAAGDLHDGVRARIRGHDQLQLGRARADAVADGRQREIHNEVVERRQNRANQQDHQRPAVVAARRRRGVPAGTQGRVSFVMEASPKE